MKEKSSILLKSKTLVFIISTMAVSFLITAAILLSYFSVKLHDNNTKTIEITSEKKTLELNYFFNTAENITKEFQDYILTNLDEKKLLNNPAYEEEFMSNLEKKMASHIYSHKGIVCSYFRPDMDKYGSTRGIFLTGSFLYPLSI